MWYRCHFYPFLQVAHATNPLVTENSIKTSDPKCYMMGGDVIAKMNYLTHTIDGRPPWFQQNSETTYVKTNFAPISTDVTVHDLRGKEQTPDLDTHGFALLNYEGTLQEEFQQNSEEQRAHYQEISDLVRQHLGASRVLVYHHVFRARGSPRSIEEQNDNRRNPLFYPHVDLDRSGAYAKVKELLGVEVAERTMGSRFQIVNVWRPIGPHPITDKPLTICDYRSIHLQNDVRPLEVHGRTTHSTAYTMSRSEQDAHDWYYLSRMQSNEMFIFKIFDSRSDVAQFAFHTAFLNEHEPSSSMDEKSLEMRCFVSYDV